MRQITLAFCLILVGIFILSAFSVNHSSSKTGFCSSPEWGFFGHRRINRMAVFTLPPEMMVFYKKNIEYITDHSVDPDKRRYASRHEGVRHYIDIDQWGTFPFDNVPRNWTDALLRYATFHIVTTKGDTLDLLDYTTIDENEPGIKIASKSGKYLKLGSQDSILYDDYRAFFQYNVLPQYYEDAWPIAVDSLSKMLGTDLNIKSAHIVDHFSEHGILPYHLLQMQRNLEKAFMDGDATKILRYSAEFGHYLGDAHVPLHTTTNYNGQLTDQVGIHAFWESRIPELFADANFDFFVGKADYLEKPKAYFWDVVLRSHSYVDSVLLIEKLLSEQFPEDLQYCYEDRLENTIRTQCKAYAEAYNRRMDGMVEAQMRRSIHGIGSVWYTAWINAGQPDLRKLLENNSNQGIDESPKDPPNRNTVKGRDHSG